MPSFDDKPPQVAKCLQQLYLSSLEAGSQGVDFREVLQLLREGYAKGAIDWFGSGVKAAKAVGLHRNTLITMQKKKR